MAELIRRLQYDKHARGTSEVYVENEAQTRRYIVLKDSHTPQAITSVETEARFLEHVR